jgi:hypothetical protein
MTREFVPVVRIFIDVICIPTILFGWQYGAWGILACSAATIGFAYNRSWGKRIGAKF